jgi:hypothetical protein
LQRGLAIGIRNAFAALFQSRLKQCVSEDLARGFQSTLQVDRGNYRLEGIGQERRLVAPAGLFLAAPKPQVLAKP